MSKGKVKEYYPSRRFGSIIDCDSGQELIVYANSVDPKVGETLKEGQDVEYDIEHRRNENSAINVRFCKN